MQTILTVSHAKVGIPALRRCTYCEHYVGFELAAAGPCVKQGHIVVVAFDAPRCASYANGTLSQEARLPTAGEDSRASHDSPPTVNTGERS